MSLKKTEQHVVSHIHRDRIVEIAQLLCASYTPPGEEGKLAEPLQAWLNDHGIPSELHEVAPGRINVVSRIKGQANGPKFMLTGHLDTAKLTDGWSVDPFAGLVRDDQFIALGICDMKGGLAAVIEAALALKESNAELRGDIILGFVVGHLDGGSGCRTLCAHEGADFAIVAEPTGLDVVDTHTGWLNLLLTVKGKSAHTTKAKEGISAIENMAKVVLGLKKLHFSAISSDIARRSRRLRGPLCYSNIGLIRGGVAANRVASDCEATMDVRYRYGKTPESILADVRQKLGELQARDREIVANAEIVPGFPLPAYVAPSPQLVRLVRGAVGEATGQQASLISMMATTDAGIMQECGRIPTIICGPGTWPFNMIDEAMPIATLVDAARTYAIAAVRFLSHAKASGPRAPAAAL